jgi:hypothetical protein
MDKARHKATGICHLPPNRTKISSSAPLADLCATTTREQCRQNAMKTRNSCAWLALQTAKIICNIPYILESNPRPFYNFRGLQTQMRMRIERGLDSRSRAGVGPNDRAVVRAVRTIQGGENEVRIRFENIRYMSTVVVRAANTTRFFPNCQHHSPHVVWYWKHSMGDGRNRYNLKPSFLYRQGLQFNHSF